MEEENFFFDIIKTVLGKNHQGYIDCLILKEKTGLERDDVEDIIKRLGRRHAIRLGYPTVKCSINVERI